VRLLTDINIVTHCVADLANELTAWTTHLDYEVIELGELTTALCAVWDTPADVGLPYAVLGPASGAAVYIRLIESGECSGYWPPISWGWNVTEILVEDPDDLARQVMKTLQRGWIGPVNVLDH
jgi:hypothetical protein